MEKKRCLNGYWDFSGRAVSVEEPPSVWEEQKILVPSPYNVNTFSAPYTKDIAGDKVQVCGGDFVLYPEYPAEWGELSWGYYRRTVEILEESRGRRIFLKFDGLSYHSIVYVNGQKAAEEWEGFLPIEMEITHLVHYGERNEIMVGAQKAKSLIYKDDAGRNRLDYPVGSFWGEHIGGIWQDVWLIERPGIFVSDLYLVTDVPGRDLIIQYELDGAGKGVGEADGFRMECYLTDGAGNVRQIADKRIEAATGTIHWKYEEGEIQLWDIETPVLYTVTVQLRQNGKLVAEERKRTGFCHFTTSGEKFSLNGRPLKLVADAWHYMGYSVQTPEYARSYIHMAKEAGVNMIRLHAQPWPEFFYDIADEMGMLITAESAVWASHCNFSYNEAFYENSKRHVRRLVLRDRSHPSIVMWSPENECIPAYHVCGSQYTKTVEELEDRIWELVQEVRKLDGSRIISCDGSGDLGGRLPVTSIHYPGYDCPVERGKPIAIGEMGSMYYSTPDTLCFSHGESPLFTMEERLKAVAADAYHNLMGERRWAAQICVFNLVWYGLWPFPFKERILHRGEVETPGIKPGRITPYLRTLNAGMEPGRQEYFPNPVFHMAKEAYAPVRLYLEAVPGSMWKGERLECKLYIFHDKRQEGRYTLRVTSREGDMARMWLEEELCLPACSVGEKKLELAFEGTGESASLYLALLARDGGQESTVWEEVHLVGLFEKAQFQRGAEEFRKRASIPGGEWEPRSLPALFAPGEEIRFRRPVPYHILEADRYRDGRPLYFDGEGNAVIAWSRGQGLLCGLELTGVEGTEGIRLAARLGEKEMPGADGGDKDAGACLQDRRVILCEGAERRLAASLEAIGCPFEVVQDADLEQEKGMDVLLVLDEQKAKMLDQPEAEGFDKVLVMASGAKGGELPDAKIRQQNCYHLTASRDVKRWLGVYGLGLYGLESGKEQVLSEYVLEDCKDGLERLLCLPGTDWRMWNNNAEALKTVASYRSEQGGGREGCVLARKKTDHGEIYYSTLGTDKGNGKQRYLLERLLVALGTALEGGRNEAGGVTDGSDGKKSEWSGPEYLSKPI